jgi:hypothetical protein
MVIFSKMMEFGAGDECVWGQNMRGKNEKRLYATYKEVLSRSKSLCLG